MTDSGMDVRVHPLVVLHIGDHFTRFKEQGGKGRIVGALMGQQLGRRVEIVDAFDLAFLPEGKNTSAAPPVKPDEKKDSKDGKSDDKKGASGAKKVDEKDIKYMTNEAGLDLATFVEDISLFNEVYPQFEVLGWYTAADKIDGTHIQIHKTLSQFNERPLMMLADTRIDLNARDLPIAVYEEVIHVQGAKVTSEFVASSFKIESDEAERVTAVHCVKVISNVDTGGSTVAPHFTALKSAVSTLSIRLKIVAAFLHDVQSGTVKPDHSILRQIKGMCNRLPTATAVDFKTSFLSEYNDTLLVTYLASITKSNAILNEVVDKFNVAFAPQRRRQPQFF